MATFLVFRQLPGVSRDQHAAAQQAVIDAVTQSTADGHVVRYLGGFFFPGAGRAICIFGADSAADVAMVNQRAGVPFTELLEAIEPLLVASSRCQAPLDVRHGGFKWSVQRLGESRRFSMS